MQEIYSAASCLCTGLSKYNKLPFTPCGPIQAQHTNLCECQRKCSLLLLLQIPVGQITEVGGGAGCECVCSFSYRG